jgi:DNA (cytosine-5)-methyltransferase 1
MRTYNVVELYAGVARTWEPFRSWKRAKLGLLVDNEQFAADTYRANFPTAPYIKRNLRWMKPYELEVLAGGKVDILLGCPPCQGFSDTGKRDPTDPRNNHITLYGRYVEALRPSAVVMENVPLMADSPLFTRFKRRLERCGYKYAIQVVNAAQYGSCQTRQRLVLVAIHATVGAVPRLDAPTHGGERSYFSYQRQHLVSIDDYPNELLGMTPASHRVQKTVTVSRVLGKEPIPVVSEIFQGLPSLGSRNASDLSHVAWPSSKKMIERMSRVPEGGRWRGGEDHFSHAYGRLHRRGLARTITTYFSNPGSGRFWHPLQERPLTLREAARIQGFDDSFRFQGAMSRSSRLIGNALDRAIADVAFRAVQRCLD